MEEEMIYLQNLITINLINMKKKDDPLTIFLVLSEIKEQMKDHEKGLLKNAWLCFEKYLELAIVSLFISYYADSKFTDYKRFLLEMSKNFYQQKRVNLFLQKELRDMEKNKEYKDLATLYQSLYLLVKTKFNCLQSLAEESLKLKGNIEGYTYESNLEIEDPKKYEQEINKRILLLRERKNNEKNTNN